MGANEEEISASLSFISLIFLKITSSPICYDISIYHNKSPFFSGHLRRVYNGSSYVKIAPMTRTLIRDLNKHIGQRTGEAKMQDVRSKIGVI